MHKRKIRDVIASDLDFEAHGKQAERRKKSFSILFGLKTEGVKAKSGCYNYGIRGNWCDALPIMYLDMINRITEEKVFVTAGKEGADGKENETLRI